MPRLYLTTAELLEHPIGLVLTPQINRLPPTALDKLLFKASQRCDSYCRKRLQAHGTTTVGTGGISSGGTSLPVVSTLTFDNKAENAVIVGVGLGTQEVIPIVPGGVSVSNYASPYPGTLTLATPALNAHSAGETIQGCYYEVGEAGSSSASEIYSEVFTQEAQLAMAHAPLIGQGSNLTRLVFLKNYPIIVITKVEHAYPFSSNFYTLNQPAITIEPTSGFYRLSLGSIVIPQGMMRTTYQGGYMSIADDIKEATALYFRESMTAFGNMYGVQSTRMGKAGLTFRQGPISPNVLEAELLLEPYRRMT